MWAGQGELTLNKPSAAPLYHFNPVPYLVTQLDKLHAQTALTSVKPKVNTDLFK